jgi:hypothetical protein
MASGIDIAPIRVRLIEQQLQTANELQADLTRAQDREQPEGTSGIRGAPVFEPGEILPARVLENLGTGRYLVLIKDMPFIADSHIQLASGSEITVRVERPAPDIRLALVKLPPEISSHQELQSNIVNEYLKWQRANHDGIKNLLTMLSEIIETPADRNSLNPALLAGLSRDTAALLRELVTSLHFDGANLDGNWIRNYAARLGLTVESELFKSLVSGSDFAADLKGPDLKSALAEIALQLKAEETAAPSIAERALLKSFSALVDSGIKSIEALQVANVALQDSWGQGAFQAPVVFQHQQGTAHLFIDGQGGEEQESSGEKRISRKVLLLLDFDRLGAMRVEASLAEGRIDCLFRCENSAAKDLVAGGLDSLKESLEAAGCRVSTLGCIADGEVRRENQISLNERLGRGESLSLFA